jgi:hypothetical protein
MGLVNMMLDVYVKRGSRTGFFMYTSLQLLYAEYSSRVFFLIEISPLYLSTIYIVRIPTDLYT